jgi:hypothetical protein
VYGWKVLVLIEVRTRLPLAMKLVKIQDDEGSWLIPLLEQAQANLGPAAQLASVVIDRGYLDGADLWQVHQKGLLLVIVGKATWRWSRMLKAWPKANAQWCENE